MQYAKYNAPVQLKQKTFMPRLYDGSILINAMFVIHTTTPMPLAHAVRRSLCAQRPAIAGYRSHLLGRNLRVYSAAQSWSHGPPFHVFLLTRELRSSNNMSRFYDVVDLVWIVT